MRRRGHRNTRSARPNQFYPIFINKATGFIESIGDALPKGAPKENVAIPDGCYAIFPLTPDGDEMIWGKRYDSARSLWEQGYIRVRNGKTPEKAIVEYLTTGIVDDINSGKIAVTGKGPQGEVLGHRTDNNKLLLPKATWFVGSHNADAYGSVLLKKTIGENRFTYPKSLYSVRDTLNFCVGRKADALIVDFFAGSGTTLHAVNLLNAEDGGHRRCIMVTNNEVSEAEGNNLKKKGFHPGDSEWEQLGIARHVTWPRTVCSITGKDVFGKKLSGTYGVEVDDFLVDNDSTVLSKSTGKQMRTTVYKKTKKQLYPALAQIKKADGFAANCEYFKLGFLDRNRVSLGMQFEEILPLLWLKSGAVGKRPELQFDEEPIMLVLPENRFAVLVEEAAFSTFAKEVAAHDCIDTVYFVTNSESAFHEMSANIGIKNTHQLYREYIDNFVIGARRDAR